MDLGKRVRVTKGDYRDDIGIIRQMIGNGHARRWVVQFDNDKETELHARSLEIQDDYEDSGTEDEEKNSNDVGNGAGNELEFLQIRVAVLKFDFSKLIRIAKVSKEAVNEFGRFLALKAVCRGIFALRSTFILVSIYIFWINLWYFCCYCC